MEEHYVSFECAKRLHELGFDGTDKYYVTENFCMGDNPYFFDTFSAGDLVDEHIVYFVNENNEDDYRGIPAPRLDQAQAWLRDKGIIVYTKPILKSVGDEELQDFKFILKGYRFHVIKLDNAHHQTSYDYPTDEQALSAGIDKALELLTNKF